MKSSTSEPSSETQGQIVGARESLNGRKNVARSKSKEQREEPLGTMFYQTSSKQSPLFWLLIGARKLVSEARTAVTVWDWSGKTLSPGALLAFLYFLFGRLDFPSSPQSICPWVSEDASEPGLRDTYYKGTFNAVSE